MADTDAKILKALEGLSNRLDEQGKVIAGVSNRLDQQGKALESLQVGQARLENGQARIKTVLETLEARQDDIREQLTTKADKADILNLGVKLDKYQKQNERRFENLEDVTGTHNPNKN